MLIPNWEWTCISLQDDSTIIYFTPPLPIQDAGAVESGDVDVTDFTWKYPGFLPRLGVKKGTVWLVSDWQRQDTLILHPGVAVAYLEP
jgi:hypothetical protein